MKKLSKLLSVLLCLAMVIGIFTMAVSAADPVTSVTYDFSDLTRKGTELNTDTAKPTFDGAASGNYLVSVATTKIYDGNGSGGAFSSTAGLLKSGTSSLSGQIVLTYESSVRITKVEILCHSWKTDGTYDTVAVNGSTPQDAPSVNPATAGTLTFDLAGDSNVVTIDFNKRVFIFKIVVYAAETGFIAPSIPATAIEIPETAEIVAGTSLKMSATVTPSTTTDDITWTSSNEAVATVDDGTIKALKAGTTTITVTAGSVSDTCAVTVAPLAGSIASAPAVNVPFNLAMAQNQEGKVYYFIGEKSGNYLSTSSDVQDAVSVYLESAGTDGNYYLYFMDAANAKTYIFINDSKKVALTTPENPTPTSTFTFHEEYKALQTTFVNGNETETYYIGTYNQYNTIGSSNISFIDDSNVDVSQYPARLYVIPVTGVTLDKTSQNMTVGNTMDLVATVAPGNATNKAVIWSSNKTDVATVDQTGKVTAVAPGNATITVTTEDGSKTATCEITVVAATVPATGVTLDKTSETLNVGGEVNLTATVAPADTTDTLTWTTSNADVATVAGGKVTAVGVGTATITAKAGDKTATCTITVAVAVSKVELDKTTANMTVGGETTLTATVTVNPNADTYKNVTWTTSDATVATVENGKVKALKAGTVTITAISATDNTKKAECAITITEPVVSTNEGKITSLDQLVTGTYVLVVDSGYAAGVLDGTWVTFVQPTIEGDKVTNAKGGIWTLTVNGDGTVTITDANGKTIAPQGGGKNNVKEGECNWTVAFKDGKFTFSAVSGDNTHYLTSNITEGQDYTNKFRAYKQSSISNAPDSYLNEFTLYAVASTGTGSGSGSTGNENTGSGSTGNESTGSGSTGNESTGSGGTDNENTGNENTGSGETVKTEYTVQSTPTAGKSYKYGLYQGANKTQLWFTGEMDGYYLAMSQDVKDAVDVTVETVEGGYRLSFTKDGVKKYIDIVERTDKAGSANVIITDEPSAVLTWDATAKTFFTKIGENTFYLGTYNTYKTISASNISYITGDNASKVDESQYVSHLYLDQPSSTGDTFEPMVIILALVAVSALAVLVLNKKKFSF